MACPLFIPRSPLGRMLAPAAPLGELYDGTCAADPAATPDEKTLRRYCNFGRARGKCHSASQSDADAIRFTLQGQTAGSIQVAWALDRDHHPVDAGVDDVPAGNPGIPPTEPRAAQVAACVASYLRRVESPPARI